MANNGPGRANSTSNVYNRDELVALAYQSGVPQVAASTDFYYAGPHKERIPTNMNYTPSFGGSSFVGAVGNAKTASAMRPVAGANTYFARMSQAERNRWNKAASKALGWDVSKQPLTSMNYYNQAATGAAAYLQATNEPISPEEWMLKMAGGNTSTSSSSGGGGGGGGYSGPVTSVSKQKVIDLTNPSEAKTLVDTALTNYLGRNATDQEQQEFLKALNKLERQNPTVQRSKQTTVPKGLGMQVTNAKTVSRGGIDPATVADEYAASRDDAAERRMSGKYMDWFMAKLAEDPMKGLSSGL